MFLGASSADNRLAPELGSSTQNKEWTGYRLVAYYLAYLAFTYANILHKVATRIKTSALRTDDSEVCYMGQCQ